MKDFYCKESNFEFLFNEVSILLSDIITESSLAEGWLEDLYVTNKYNTTRAMEKHTANIILSKMKESEMSEEELVNILNVRLDSEDERMLESSFNDKLYMANNVKNIKLNKFNFESVLEDFELTETIEYIKENYLNEEFEPNNFNIEDENTKRVLNILESIKSSVRENSNNLENLRILQECTLSILYKYKSDIFVENTKPELSENFDNLEILLKDQPDSVIEYTIKELYHLNNLMEYFIDSRLANHEAKEEDLYVKAVETFNNLVESIFLDESDNDIKVKDMIKLYMVTEALCEYESTLEASSRIITKGTEKVTKSIGKASSKSHGMSSSTSKVGQIKRGARIIDDRASSAINRKLDDIMNFTRDQKREKLITGKNTVKLGKCLKTLIKVAGSAAAMKAWQGPVVGTITTIIGLLVARALSKRTEEREKKRILLELETELKITKEKIEDAKGDNAKEQKYQLMRIEANLEKEIMRIKHGMRYY